MVANFFSKSTHRPLFLMVLKTLEEDGGTGIIPSSADWWAEGLELFTRRTDKDWSLTDRITFCMMTKLGLTHAVTADKHFEQAGFTRLLG